MAPPKFNIAHGFSGTDEYGAAIQMASSSYPAKSDKTVKRNLFSTPIDDANADIKPFQNSRQAVGSVMKSTALSNQAASTPASARCIRQPGAR